MFSEQEKQQLNNGTKLVKEKMIDTQHLLNNVFQLLSTLPKTIGDPEFDRKIAEIRNFLNSTINEIMENSSTLQRISNFQDYFKRHAKNLSQRLDKIGISQSDVENCVDLILNFLEESQDELSDINSNCKKIKSSQKQALQDFSAWFLQESEKHGVRDLCDKVKIKSDKLREIQKDIEKDEAEFLIQQAKYREEKSKNRIDKGKKLAEIANEEKKLEFSEKIISELQTPIQEAISNIKKSEKPLDISLIVEEANKKYLQNNLDSLKQLYDSQFPYNLPATNPICHETMEHFKFFINLYMNDLKGEFNDKLKNLSNEQETLFKSMEIFERFNKNSLTNKNKINQLRKDVIDLQSQIDSVLVLNYDPELKKKEIAKIKDEIKDIETQIKAKLGPHKGENFQNSMHFSHCSSDFLLDYATFASSVAKITETLSIYLKFFKIQKKSLQDMLNYTCTKIDMDNFNKSQVIAVCKTRYQNNEKLLECIEKNNLFGQVLIDLVLDHPNPEDAIWEEIPLKNKLQKKSFQRYFSTFLGNKQAKSQKGMIQQIINNIINLKI